MNKFIHRGIALLAVLALCLSLCACGGSDSSKRNPGKSNAAKDSVWYMGGSTGLGSGTNPEAYFADIADTVNPAEIYRNTTITADMLCGSYTLNNREKDIADVRKTIPFEELTFKDGPMEVTILPSAVFFGEEYVCNRLTAYHYSDYKGYTEADVAVLELPSADKLVQICCTYEVDGNSVLFKQIRQTSEEDAPLTYEFTGLELRYGFELAGPCITFSRDGHSLQLTAFCMTENTDEDLWMVGYSLQDSPLIHGIDYFSSSDLFNYAVSRDGTYYKNPSYKFSADGKLTVYAEKSAPGSTEKEIITSQYAYIIQSDASNFLTNFSIVLLDGEKVYYYTDNITQREARVLANDGVDVGQMTDEQIEEIAEKKADLFDELQKEFEAKGIQVSINRATGEIALDSTVLFGVNESDIADDGKAFLKDFMAVYTGVVFSEKYAGFISRIMVEGHTDTTGDYGTNQALSEARAESVKAYCLSEDCAIDAAHIGSLQTMLEAVGYSYDKPVYDASGEVDMDASRRVSFRFIVNIESQG